MIYTPDEARELARQIEAAADAAETIKATDERSAAEYSRLTDVANRPIVVPESYRSTLGDLGEPSGGVRQPKPNFRDPGNLSNESSFVPYSDEDAAMREVLRGMRQNGISETDIAEMVEEYQKQK